MTRLSAVLAALACLAASQSRFPADLAGQHEWPVLMWDYGDGGAYRVDRNMLNIKPEGHGSAHIEVEVKSYRGNVCAIEGNASWNGRELVYRAPKDDLQAPGCRLKIWRQGEWLIIDDATSCEGYCGANTYLSGVRFPAKPTP